MHVSSAGLIALYSREEGGGVRSLDIVGCIVKYEKDGTIFLEAGQESAEILAKHSTWLLNSCSPLIVLGEII